MGHKVKLPLTSQSSTLSQLSQHLIICYPTITLRILCPDNWHSSVYVTYRETLHQVLCKTDTGSFCHLHQAQTLEIFSRKSHILCHFLAFFHL